MRPALDDTGSVLQRLILEGEAVLQRRRVQTDYTHELRDAVQRLYLRPADGRRVIDDHTSIFVQALHCCGEALARHDNERAAKYGRVIGVLIDDIRSDFEHALDQRKRPTP